MDTILLGLISLIIGLIGLKYMKTKKQSDGESLVWCIGGIFLGLMVLIAGILQLIFV